MATFTVKLASRMGTTCSYTIKFSIKDTIPRLDTNDKIPPFKGTTLGIRVMTTYDGKDPTAEELESLQAQPSLTQALELLHPSLPINP